MTLRALFATLVLALAAVCLTAPGWLWWLAPENPLVIRVVDKTVPHPNYREHAGLHWVLSHAKTTPMDPINMLAGQRPWLPSEDYVGFHPEELDERGHPMQRLLLDHHLDGVELLYLADVYGVYVDDFPPDHILGRAVGAFDTHLDYSKKIFGGIEVEEVERVEKFVAEGGHLISEFNTFASPSHGEARRRMEALLRVTWTGWAGRWFEDLGSEDDVPEWARRHWREHYDEEWTWEGPGWLVAHEDTRLFVLAEDQHVDASALCIIEPDRRDPLMRGTVGRVPFYYWFDVVEPHKYTEVLATYEFKVNDEGAEIMRGFGVPERFPAVVKSSDKPLRVYFAGDFSDLEYDPGFYGLAGVGLVQTFGMWSEYTQDQRAFFWRFYLPMVRNAVGLARDQERP